MSANRHWAVFLGLAALIVVLDQLTKAWLVSFLAPGQAVDVVGDWIRLVFSQNNGGLFGLLKGQAVIFGLISLVVVGLIVLYHARADPSRYLSITLGLLLGGAIGNLIDRFRLGYVVDFVDAGIGGMRWYTFNVADTGISFALLLLLAASVVPSVARKAGLDGGTTDRVTTDGATTDGRTTDGGNG
ncbi:MAG TPA: signal peptidase II [Candidatus Limnocylindrales bacterium]|nr:signal peptidase II [Candidatus Limnocylindrales bacterium]